MKDPRGAKFYENAMRSAARMAEAAFLPDSDVPIKVFAELVAKSCDGRRAQSQGGKDRAENARIAAAEHWTGDYFRPAYTALQKSGRRVIGPSSLADKAYLLAEAAGKKSAEFTEYRARQWLKRQP